MITGAQPSDSGEYTAVFVNSCGEVESEAATVQVIVPCIADYNGSGDAGDILDFLDFVADFDTCSGQTSPCGQFGDPDLNGDGVIDILDLLDFLQAFDQGC
jgi:hypothetical protein